MLKSRKKSYFLLTMVCIIALAAMAVSGVLSDAEKIKMAKVNEVLSRTVVAQAPAEDQQQSQKSAQLSGLSSISELIAPQVDPAVDEALAAKVALEQEILRRLELESAQQGADKGGPIDRSMISDVDLNPKGHTGGPENVPQHLENGEKQGGDDIANATVIGAIPYSDAGTTSGFVDDYDEVCPYSGSTAPDVVYSFAATVDTFLFITLCNGSAYDTKLFVYEDAAGNLVDCNDDLCPGWVSELACVPIFAGHTYYIVIDGYDGSSFGDYVLDVDYCVPEGPCVWECPAGAVQESEACGDDTDGGCNMTVPNFEPIDCGVTVCGTVWADAGSRDTDWYTMTVSGAQMVSLMISGNFPWVGGFIDTADCGLASAIDPYVLGMECDTGIVSRAAVDQTIWLFVSHQAFDGNPCGTSNDYFMEVSCAPITTGACCYVDGSCTPDMDEGPCVAGGGTWMAGVPCTPNPCPQPAPQGADCVDPIKVDIPTLPYSNTNTTCGMLDDYSNTCLGSYDGGEDIIYEVTVAGAAVDVDINMTSDGSWTGLVIDASCPPDPSTCMATATGSSSDKSLPGVHLEPGVYYIMIDTWPSPACLNNLTLTITESGAPQAGDNCADAVEIGEVTDLPFSTNSATPDEAGGCMTSPNIWYNYTAGFTGDVIVSLCGSSYDTKLAAYNGTCGALTSIDCNDDAPCAAARALQSEITFPVTAGSSYLVEVGGYSSSTGDGILNIYEAPATPPNDNCADVTPLPLPQVNNGNNTGATNECGFFSGGHVWEAFVIDTCMDVTLEYCGSAGVWGNAWLNLAVGCPCSDYTDAASYAFSCGDGNLQMTWANLPAGTYYYPVMLDPANGSVGDYTITITGVEVPCPTPCQVDCPTGGIPEGETCPGDESVDVTNGGCNSTPPVFGAIECGTAVCGSSSTFLFGGSNYRDTDWYLVTLADFNQLTWTVESEIAEMLIFVVAANSGDCADYEILGSTTSTEDCTPISLTFDLGPGDYWVLAMPSVFTGYPCSGGAQDYVGTLTCTPIAPVYCDASGGCDEYIQRVEVGTIDNTSSCEGYGDFTGMSTPMEPGGSYAITVTLGGAWSADAASMWIDYNQDYVFDPATEETFLGTGYGPYTATINVPGTAVAGPTRMRIRMCYACTPAPCGASSYGEVEDYTVNIGALAGNLIVAPPSLDFGTVAPGATGSETLTLTVDDGTTDIDFTTEINYGGKTGSHDALYAILGNQIPAKAPYTGPQNIPQVDKQGGEDIGTATAIGALPYNDAGTTSGYTDDYDEACPYTGSTSPDVVYSYTPASDESVNISLCNGSAYDTKLFVYENSYTPGAPFACNDDACPGYVSELTGLALIGGNTYYIVIDGYGGDFGSYVIDVDVNVPPPPFDCPAGSVTEAEACGDDTNGGCNMTVPAFEAVNCGDTVCGYGWANTSLRETDWYQVEMFTPGPITMTMTADFPFIAGFIDTADCGLVAGFAEYALGNPGDTITVTHVAGEGIYWVFAAPSEWSDISCAAGPNYWFTLDCDPGSAPVYWLSVDPISGTVPGAGSLPVVATYDATGLDFGTYTADIVFIRTGKANVVVPVTLTVGETFATMVMDPDPVFAFMQYAVGDLSGHVYIGGDFDPPHTPDDITGVTLTANSAITINSTSVIAFQEDIGGPALDIDFDLVQLSGDYGVLYDLSTQAYNVTGTYASGGFSLDGEIEYRGHVSGDLNIDGSVDVADLTFFVEFLFAGGPPPHVMVTADCNASGTVDVGDLTYFVDYLFAGGPAPSLPEM